MVGRALFNIFKICGVSRMRRECGNCQGGKYGFLVLLGGGKPKRSYSNGKAILLCFNRSQAECMLCTPAQMIVEMGS